MDEGRVHGVTPADYTAGGDLDARVLALIAARAAITRPLDTTGR
jgi:hypothetical protein